MRGVNKVILVGNLGHDVEVRQLANGNPVANLRIATNERWTKRDTGQVQEHTEWHNIVLFGRRAELAGEHLGKGARIYIEGRLRTRAWSDREGQDRRSTEVVADDMQFLDRRGERSNGQADSPRGGTPRGGTPPRGNEAPRGEAPRGEAPRPGGGFGGGDGGDDYDDIPF